MFHGFELVSFSWDNKAFVSVATFRFRRIIWVFMEVTLDLEFGKELVLSICSMNLNI